MRALGNWPALPQGPASTTGAATATFDFPITRSTFVIVEVYAGGFTAAGAKCSGRGFYAVLNDANGNVTYTASTTNALDAVDLLLAGVTMSPSVPGAVKDVLRITMTGIVGQTITWVASAFYRAAVDQALT